MLKRMAGLIATVMLGVTLTAVPAFADTTCVVSEKTGTCIVSATKPGSSGSDNSGSSSACLYGGQAIACSRTSAVYGVSASWSNSRQCYIAALPKQPPETDPVWDGHYPTGRIYFCEPPGATSAAAVSFFWYLPTLIELVDPEILARTAIERMNLHAPQIGIVPDDTAGSVGIIGLPVWLWVADPGPSVTGPITRTASAGGTTVTATARVKRVAWDLGDGTSITCGIGTPYSDSYGTRPSPDCGHVYQKQGTYTVRVTTSWAVTWNGAGESGVINLTFSNSTQITEGEVQVIIR